MKEAGASQANTVVPSSPLTAGAGGVPAWVPLIALFLSVFTLIKTLYNDWKASRAKQLTKFDADYGTPLRQAIRAFEKNTLNSLRTYTLASGLSVADLKAEIAKEHQKWLSEIYELSKLLEELDSSDQLVTGPWAPDFARRSEAAEIHILAMIDLGVVNGDQIATLARSAREELTVGITEIRTCQKSESASYDKWGPRR